MADGIKVIIQQLEQQKDAIERALSALRSIQAPAPAPAQHVRNEEVVVSKGATRKRRITAEGRRRLAEAMKRRWAIKRTAAQAKKGSRPRKAA